MRLRPDQPPRPFTHPRLRSDHRRSRRRPATVPGRPPGTYTAEHTARDMTYGFREVRSPTDCLYNYKTVRLCRKRENRALFTALNVQSSPSSYP